MVDDRFLLTIGLVDLLVAVVSIKWGHWLQHLRRQKEETTACFYIVSLFFWKDLHFKGGNGYFFRKSVTL